MTLQAAAQGLVDRIADFGASPLDWPEYTALEKALEAAQAVKSRTESLYEELRKAIDEGSESMTHADALKQIAYWQNKAQQVAVPVPMTDIEVLRAARTVQSVFEHVPHRDVIEFVRAIEAHHGIGAKP